MTPLVVGLACFLVFNANLRQVGSGDTLPSRYLPLVLWREGTLELGGQARLAAHGHALQRYRPAGAADRVLYFEPSAYWLIRTREHQLASLYPVVTPLLVAPLYVPAVLWLDARGWLPPHVDRVAELMEKVSASLLAAAACVIVYLILRRDCARWSIPLTAAFAFGTNTWMISSQALWQHGTGELLIALALFLATAPLSPGRTALLGALCVLMAANRPPDALFAAAFALAAVWSRRRNAAWLLAGAAIPLAALLHYNLGFIGHIAGGYAVGKSPSMKFFHVDWTGVPGLLVSPARGLLVFSPFLAFTPVGLVRRLREPRTNVLAVALGSAAIAQILLYSQADWRAGEAWGPRWLTDLLPILIWMLAPALYALRPVARRVLALTIAMSVLVQAIGAFWYTKTSDEAILAGDFEAMSAAWDPANLPFLAELRHPRAAAELLDDARGSLDLVGPTRVHTLDEIPALDPGAVLEGWALTGGRTPAQLLVLIDGIVVGATSEFLPRPDVDQALGTTAPSGWRVLANTSGVSPGERVLQIAVRIAPRSDIRVIREQRVLVAAPSLAAETGAPPLAPASGPELDAMAARAARLLREHQDRGGYWLTSYTSGPSYEAPHLEMNTFLTAVLVDLLSPVDPGRGLGDVVERARGHLASQIEDDGTVRYHGRPDGPTIGTLGCVITPDADDTALAWRISGLGAADPRERRMLGELARYRDGRGLYRTWLAPSSSYRCIDPGVDPNPTDATIQMHVYLMLRGIDPSAAQDLCASLRRSFSDGDLWVYYAKAPLVPYLRSEEVRRQGCDIPFPMERLALPARGQEIWSEAARRLVETAASPLDAKAREEVRGLLARLGRGDFAGVRRSPPLLYHNDPTASVRRFYWSEDFGYALWLRLYAAVAAGTEDSRRTSP